MSLNPNGAVSYNWNYSKKDREGYSEELIGTVVAIQEVQAREWTTNGQPGRPVFWPSGNPKMNIRIGLATQEGQLKSITFQEAGRAQRSGKKPSLHMQLFNLTNSNMMELMGKTLHFKTWPANPNTGQMWGVGNPRLFAVEIVENATPFSLSFPLPGEFQVPELYADAAVSGGQMGTQPQQIQTPVNVPEMGSTAQYPYAQQQPVMQQPMMQQPVMQQPMMQQPVMQQPTAQMPVGMDPSIASAMQAAGAVNVQPVENEPQPYYTDEDIPW